MSDIIVDGINLTKAGVAVRGIFGNGWPCGWTIVPNGSVSPVMDLRKKEIGHDVYIGDKFSPTLTKELMDSLSAD